MRTKDAGEADTPGGLLPKGWLRSAGFRRICLAAFAVSYGAYFLWMTRAWHTAWFYDDDLLNLNSACLRNSWASLLGGGVIFFGHVIRPLPELLVRVLYSTAGFHAGPYNVTRILLSGADVVLTYAFASRLARSREVGLLCVLLAGFHPALFSLYFENGMLFDLCAFLFYYAGLALYLHWRREGRFPGAWQTAVIVAIYIAALDSKEIAVSFPAALLLVELVVLRPQAGRLGRQFLMTALTGLMTLAYVVGKNTGPDALANAAAYAPHFAAATYLDAYAHYAGQFTTWSDTAIRPAIAWVLAGCILAAVALRNRVLQWAALFNVVAIAPIAFISPRNGFAFYVPLVGWAVFVAALLRQAREFAVRRRPALRVWSQAALAAALAFSVPYREIRPMNRVRLPAVRADQNEARRLYGEIRGLLPEALEHKRVLALNEPYKFEYAFVLIVQFAWNEPDLTVFTAKLLRERGIQPSPQDYDVVLDYVDGHFVRVDASRRDQGRGEP